MLLVIGNKRYSSWSLRPWLLMKQFAIAFDERLIPLGQPETQDQIRSFSPSGKLPVLIDNDITVWDSLAIAEYLNEKFPQKQMWPRDPRRRALARSVTNEIHSGFQTMRSLMPNDLQKRVMGFDWTPARADVERVLNLWTEFLNESGGPFLFCDFSIADAMYAPVINRLVTYGVPVTGAAQKYVTTFWGLPAHRQWVEEALKEK